MPGDRRERHDTKVMAMTDQPDDVVENYFLLTDPAWQPRTAAETPPFEAVIGLWPLGDDGRVGKFRSNPEYEPLHEDSPSDPIDALVRLALRGDAEIGQLQLVLRDSLFDLAMNGDGRPLVIKSPDDLLCVVIATSAPHRARVGAPDWRSAELADVVDVLTDGMDVLVNPGGPATVRLTGDFIRSTATMDDDQLAAAQATFQPDERFAAAGTAGEPVSQEAR